MTTEKVWDITVDVQKFEEDYKNIDKVDGEVPFAEDDDIGLTPRFYTNKDCFDSLVEELSKDSTSSYIKFGSKRVIGVRRSSTALYHMGARFLANNTFGLRNDEHQLAEFRNNYLHNTVEVALVPLDGVGDIEWVALPPSGYRFTRVNQDIIDLKI